MAEVVGLVASGAGIASLAMQIGGSLMQLKELCGKIKSAGDDIRECIEEIEVFNQILEDMERDNEEMPNFSDVPQLCIVLCRQVLATLSKEVKALETQISKRRLLGSIRATAKQGSIAGLRERLNRAQLLLLSSHQIYSIAIQRRHHLIQLDCHEVQIVELAKVQAHFKESQGGHQKLQNLDSPRKKQNLRERQTSTLRDNKGNLVIRIRPFGWLGFSGRCWDLLTNRNVSGWTFTLRTYNIIPDGSDIMDYVANGDIVNIQKLFSLRQASPLDREADGTTLLDRAAMWNQLETCRFLLSEGADPNVSLYETLIPGAPCLATLLEYNGWESFGLGGIALLTQNTDCEVWALEQNFIIIGLFETLAWLLDLVELCEGSKKLETLDFIHNAVYSIAAQPNFASQIHPRVERSRLRYPRSGDLAESFPLLNLSAGCLAGFCARHSLEYNDHLKASDLCKTHDGSELCLLIYELVKARSDVFQHDYFWRPPLYSFFYSFVRTFEFIRTENAALEISDRMKNKLTTEISIYFPAAARLWLEQLSKAGKELVEYGEIEQSSSDSQDSVKQVRKGTILTWYNSKDSKWVCTYLRLSTFSYGPSPDDWDFCITEAMEWEEGLFLLDFWDMIEHPERAIPGAWNDFDD